MSQVLYIDESCNVVGHLNNHHVEKLLSSSSSFHIEKGRAEQGERGCIIFSSPFLPLDVVIDKRHWGFWERAWHRGRLYLQTTNKKYSLCPTIPNNVICLARETIAQLNAILAFDCTLSYKLRIFDTEIKST